MRRQPRFHGPGDSIPSFSTRDESACPTTQIQSLAGPDGAVILSARALFITATALRAVPRSFAPVESDTGLLKTELQSTVAESMPMDNRAVDGPPGEITVLLRKATQGQTEAADELVRIVYKELRRVAGDCMRREPSPHTLQPTALINEAWLRLQKQTQVEWRDRKHFFGVAAQMMRRALVDHARTRLADKRGGGAPVMTLDWVEIEASPHKLEEILAVDEALARLRQFDQQQAQIVELHYFAGMTVKETAGALDLSCRAVNREWAMATAWLRRELSHRGAA